MVRLPVDHLGEYLLSPLTASMRLKVSTMNPDYEVVLYSDPIVETDPIILCDLHGHDYGRDGKSTEKVCCKRVRFFLGSVATINNLPSLSVECEFRT